jgi:hypothetical protein
MPSETGHPHIPLPRHKVMSPFHENKPEHPLIPTERRLKRCKPLEWTRLEATTREIVLAAKKRRSPQHMPSQYVERFPMSRSEFRELEKLLGGDEDLRYVLKVFLAYYKLTERFRWPRISFNAKTSTGIIQWMPSGVHEALTAPFIRSQGIGTQDLRPEILDRVEVVGSQTLGEFYGAYAGSRKEPDVLFKYFHPNGDVWYSAVVEVGLAETYEELCDDVTQWIEGNHNIRTAILIKVTEEPCYKSPFTNLEDDEVMALGFPPPRDLVTSMVVLENPNNLFGPLELNGLTWVGQMTVFLEIWKRDQTNGLARKYGSRKVELLIFHHDDVQEVSYTNQSDSKYFVPHDGISELNLRLSDFYPLDATNGGNVRFPLTFDQLRRHLRRTRAELAVERCREALEKVTERSDRLSDRDYHD